MSKVGLRAISFGAGKTITMEGISMERKNKGLAWAWLKAQMIERIGADAAQVILSGYYERLSEEYRDRKRVAAAGDLVVLEGKLAAAELACNRRDIVRYERMIEARRRLVS